VALTLAFAVMYRPMFEKASYLLAYLFTYVLGLFEALTFGYAEFVTGGSQLGIPNMLAFFFVVIILLISLPKYVVNHNSTGVMQ